jgi:hypothetical protein
MVLLVTPEPIVNGGLLPPRKVTPLLAGPTAEVPSTAFAVTANVEGIVNRPGLASPTGSVSFLNTTSEKTGYWKKG